MSHPLESMIGTQRPSFVGKPSAPCRFFRRCCSREGSSPRACWGLGIMVLAIALSGRALGIEIQLIPAGGTGTVTSDTSDPMATEVTIQPGQTVRVDVRVDDWGAGGELLRAVQVEMMISSLTSGPSGSLSLTDLDAANDGTCDFAAELCPICGPPFSLNGVFVDSCRRRCNTVNGSPCNPNSVAACPGEGGQTACQMGFKDFFGQMPNLNGLGSGAALPNFLALIWAGNLSGVGAAFDGQPHYDGSYVFTASPDAFGTFTLNLWNYSCIPMGCNTNGTFVRNHLSQPFVQPTLLGQASVHVAALCGNGVVEPGEECDDGDTDEGDGCSADCVIEIPRGACCTPAGCIDSIVQADCSAQGGEYQGDDVYCHATICAAPPGSCRAGCDPMPVLTRQQAVAIVASQIPLVGDSLIWTPYEDYGFGAGFEGLLPRCTIVRPQVVDAAPFNSIPTKLSGPTYLFWHDLNTLSMYAHPTEFIYVDATVSNPSLAAGTIVVQPQGWWGIMRRPGEFTETLFGPGQRYTTSLPSYDNPDGLVLGEVVFPDDRLEPPPPPLPIASAEATNPPPGLGNNPCAIIISGSPNRNQPDSHLCNNVELMRQQFANRGVPADRIKHKKNATTNDLKTFIGELCNLNPACDHISVYISAHGNASALQLDNRLVPLTAPPPQQSICVMLNALGQKGVQVDILLQSCRSGAFVQNLRPKFPKGVILTSADSTHCSCAGAARGADGTHLFPGFPDLSHFTALLVRCWNEAAADMDGDGRVSWAEAFDWVCRPANRLIYWRKHGVLQSGNVKTPNPVQSGLPDKTYRYRSTLSNGEAVWVRTVCWDLDHDGRYDNKTYYLDRDCDGIDDWILERHDGDEDGNIDEEVRLVDSDDDGQADQRYISRDRDDDGDYDTTTCEVHTGGGIFVPQGAADARSQDQHSIMSNSGSMFGEEGFVLSANGITWSNPAPVVFIGSEAVDVTLKDATTITGVTAGGLPGPTDVLVIDFDPKSPSYGMDELNNGYQYTPELIIDEVDPPAGLCGQAAVVTLRGGMFDPAATVYANDTPLASAWIDAGTMVVTMPDSFCGEYVDLAVENPPVGTGDRVTLENAYAYEPAIDGTPPSITCPPTLVVTADAQGFGRIPASWQASAKDDGGAVILQRGAVGPLCPGLHSVEFVAFDATGNASTCLGSVVVQPFNPIPTVTAWGMAIMACLLCTGGTLVFGRRIHVNRRAGARL